MKLFGFCSQIPLKHLKHFQLLILSWMIWATYKLLNSTVKAAIYLLIYMNLFCSISTILMDQTAFDTAMHFHIQQMQTSCPVLLCPPATSSIKDVVTQHLHCIQPMAPSASSIEGSATPLMLALLCQCGLRLWWGRQGLLLKSHHTLLGLSKTTSTTRMPPCLDFEVCWCTARQNTNADMLSSSQYRFGGMSCFRTGQQAHMELHKKQGHWYMVYIVIVNDHF